MEKGYCAVADFQARMEEHVPDPQTNCQSSKVKLRVPIANRQQLNSPSPKYKNLGNKSFFYAPAD